MRPLADRDYLHAETVVKNGSEKRIAIAFGPEDGAIGSEYAYNAHTEALQQGFQQLFLFGFAIEAKAREMLDKLKIPTAYIAMTPDIVMSDLLKTSRSSEIFSITGLPDVTLKPAGDNLHQVEVKGLDIFRPDTMETDSIEAENLPCWMLDANYNGMVFCASQVFFPKTGAWDNRPVRRQVRHEPALSPSGGRRRRRITYRVGLLRRDGILGGGSVEVLHTESKPRQHRMIAAMAIPAAGTKGIIPWRYIKRLPAPTLIRPSGVAQSASSFRPISRIICFTFFRAGPSLQTYPWSDWMKARARNVSRCRRSATSFGDSLGPRPG